MGKKGFILPLLLLLAMLSSCLISLPAARAQLGGTSLQIPTAEDVMKSIIVFIFGSDFPDEWLTYSGFMQNIIFPFIAVFVVMYGILSELRIFHNANVKAVLSLVMAFVGGRYLLQMMRGFLVANAFWGTLVWGLLLLFGIAAWGFARGAEYYGWGRQSYENIRSRGERKAKLQGEIDTLSTQIVTDRVKIAEATDDNSRSAALEVWRRNSERLKRKEEEFKNMK